MSLILTLALPHHTSYLIVAHHPSWRLGILAHHIVSQCAPLCFLGSSDLTMPFLASQGLIQPHHDPSFNATHHTSAYLILRHDDLPYFSWPWFAVPYHSPANLVMPDHILSLLLLIPHNSLLSLVVPDNTWAYRALYTWSSSTTPHRSLSFFILLLHRSSHSQTATWYLPIPK